MDSFRLRASRRGRAVTLAAAAVLLPSATSAWGQSLVGDQAVGYVSAQANGLNGSNLFYPVVGVIGSGVEFSGYHGNEGERISYFEADFDANSFTIRMENVHFQNRSVWAVPTIWHFTDLNWLPDAQKIVGITKTADSFPTSSSYAEFTTNDGGTSAITIRQSNYGQTMNFGEVYQASFTIHTAALPEYFEFRHDAIDLNWHTTSGSDTNWKHYDGTIAQETPGFDGLNDRVHILSADVILDQQDVTIGRLSGFGTLTISKQLTITEASNFDDLTVEAGGTFNPQADVRLDDVINRGDFNVRKTVSAWDVENHSTGVITLDGGSTLDLVGDLLNHGVIRGSGTVKGDAENYGRITPGFSPGTVTIEGDFMQAAGGVLTMEIGADGYDQFIVTGQAELDGLLEIVFTDGYTPQPGMRFDLFSAVGSISGDFADVQISGLDGIDYSAGFNGGTFRLTTVPEPTTTLAVAPALLMLLSRRRRGR